MNFLFTAPRKRETCIKMTMGQKYYHNMMEIDDDDGYTNEKDKIVLPKEKRKYTPRASTVKEKNDEARNVEKTQKRKKNIEVEEPSKKKREETIEKSKSPKKKKDIFDN